MTKEQKDIFIKELNQLVVEHLSKIIVAKQTSFNFTFASPLDSLSIDVVIDA